MKNNKFKGDVDAFHDCERKTSNLIKVLLIFMILNEKVKFKENNAEFHRSK